MSDRLPRNIPGPGQRRRYGTWDLASDREPGAPLPTTQPTPLVEWSEEHEEQVRRLTRRQRRLSIVMATVLFVPALVVVAAGYLAPEGMTRIAWHGFSFSFLTTAILIYPLTWLLAAAYTLIANRMDGLR